MIGTVKRWSPERGFGFILGSNSREVFSHIRDWSNDDEIPTVGQVVEFEVIEYTRDGQTKKKAVNVRVHVGANALAAKAGAE
jgi:cold shock CspA family protein